MDDVPDWLLKEQGFTEGALSQDDHDSLVNWRQSQVVCSFPLDVALLLEKGSHFCSFSLEYFCEGEDVFFL